MLPLRSPAFVPASTSAPAGHGVLGRVAARADRRHVLESHRLLFDIARNAMAARALRRRVLAALHTDDGLASLVEWLRARGYGVSREGLLAAWVARRPMAPDRLRGCRDREAAVRTRI